jgi:D-3-phosphoglycerate dehydrogenase
MGMILAAIRRIPQTNADLLSGTWRGDYDPYENVGPELEGNTVGLIGYGAIGSRVTRMLQGFGAHVLVFDPYLDAAALAGEAEKVDLEKLLELSGIVTLHARVTPETIGMIGAAQIEAMPKGSVIVNCARGALLDLCDGLDSGHLFGAAFDVFPAEPISAGSRLLTTPGIVMTPHLAGASKQTAIKAVRIVAGDVGRFLRGEPLAHCANPNALS